MSEKDSFKFFNSYRVGVLTNLFNMKTIAFMVSIYSGFLAVPRSIFEQIFIVVVCSSLEFIWYFLVALLFGSSLVRGVFNRYRVSIDRGLSLFLVLFAMQNIYHII
ncbi:LysE type translocator [Vreelandella arcis]|uniref:LysE type translocator n=1 Tax=Vreelandella arcis TaxID=416873 RepID=A0A1H0FSQ3_9GAMM|nr:LysE type translocator [Halomonas arcis]